MIKFILTEHRHPISDEIVVGMRLTEGATLESGDLYDSTRDRWEECTCPGLVLGNTTTVWVRPGAPVVGQGQIPR